MNPLYTFRAVSAYIGILVIPTFLSADEGMATAVLDPYESVSQRSFFDSNSDKLQSSHDFDASQLQSSSLQDLTQILNTNTSLGTYRRTASKSAHPTTQGVRFRNVGINATSRALVLLDGIPQNDPFGGWVFWNKFQIDSLSSVRTSQTPQNELWGNFGSGGVISLTSLPSTGDRESLSASYGTDDSYSVSFGKSEYISEQFSLDVDARTFDSGGFETVHPDQQGPKDLKADSESDSARIRATWNTDNGWNVQAVADYFSEERSNGTALANNETTAWDYSVKAQRVIDEDSEIEISAYHQTRKFRNQFSSVSSSSEDSVRDLERPALNQHDVPADSTGASIVYSTRSKGGAEVLFGMDARTLEGEVNEEVYSAFSGTFNKGRKIGGQQDFVGFFYSTNIQVSPKTVISFSERVDYVAQTDGYRRETALPSGDETRLDIYSNRHEWVPSFNFNLDHKIDDQRNFTAGIFQGFRAPTLNELYRRFQVKNDVTGSNPNLTNETHRGVEFAYLWDNHKNLRASFKGFHYFLEDMIANALITTESGGYNPTYHEFIGDGGSYSERRNIERSEVTGIELELEAQISKSVSAILNYTYAPTKITRSGGPADQPEFKGASFPQSPEDKIFASINWTPVDAATVWVSATYWGEQFEDLAGLRRINSATSVDLGASYQIDEKSSIQLRIENAADSEIESGISSSGLISLSAPRSAWITFSYRN